MLLTVRVLYASTAPRWPRAAILALSRRHGRRHDLPVLLIGLYLRVGLDGIGWDA